MAIQIQGNAGTVADVDGTNYRAIRVNQRPLDYGSLGTYSVSGRTGTMAAGLAANAEVFNFRWTDPTRLCAITSVHATGAGNLTTAFTAGFANIELLIARSWTALATTPGGTSLLPTGNAQKLRTSMGTSLVNDVRVSSTAALSTAGRVATLDAQPIGSLTYGVTATLGTPLWPPEHLYEAAENDGMPIILAQNEGIVIRATVPATGLWVGSFDMSWVELAAY